MTAKFIRPAISSLACATATNNGILTNGFPPTAVSTVISYTGGDGSTHNGQTIASTGVTGLTATLAPGTFANGNGTLTYVITGTPSGVGTAIFVINIGNQSSTFSRMVIAPVQPSYPAGSIFCASGATTVVEVVSPTGKIWMDRNLGATRAATSSTDAQAYGDIYKWGRRSDGYQCRDSKTISVLSLTDISEHGDFIFAGGAINDWRSPQNNSLWQGVERKNNPCPFGFRLPTDSELDQELLTWPTKNSVGAFNSPLKLVLTGYNFSTIGITNIGTSGLYWNSTVNNTSSRLLSFGILRANFVNIGRATGISVRCIKD